MNQPFRKYKPRPGQWSLRNRLVIGVVVLGAFAITASDFAAQAAFRTFLIAQVDVQLESVAGGSLLRLDRAGIAAEPEETNTKEPLFQPFEPLSDVPSEVSVTLLDASGNILGTVGDIQSPQRIQTLVAGITPAEVGQYNDKPFTLDAGGRGSDYRVLARLLPSSLGSVICAISLDGVERAMNQLRFLFLAVGLIVLIFLGLIARRIIDISLRPLKSVEETAKAFAKGDFSARLEEARSDTEVGRLTSALNQMLARIDRQGAIKGEENTSELIRRIEDESVRMSSLVEDLLLLARLDQSPEMLMEPVDVGKLIKEAVESAKAARSTHEISIELEGEELFLLGDSLRIHQVIANLLANAQIHTPDGSKIIVSASQDDLATYISVSDNGPGISVESQERIFERFYRADLSRKRSGVEGTGLGLSIVDAVMKAHGGLVKVESELGKGAKFTLTFPIKDL
jgi:two-component system OmpR family sensor kinase